MTTLQLRDLLARLGAVSPTQDPAGITVTETLMVEKFDGDDGPLVERIVIEPDGTVSEHWRHDAAE